MYIFYHKKQSNEIINLCGIAVKTPSWNGQLPYGLQKIARKLHFILAHQTRWFS